MWDLQVSIERTFGPGSVKAFGGPPQAARAGAPYRSADAEINTSFRVFWWVPATHSTWPYSHPGGTVGRHKTRPALGHAPRSSWDAPHPQRTQLRPTAVLPLAQVRRSWRPIKTGFTTPIRSRCTYLPADDRRLRSSH